MKSVLPIACAAILTAASLPVLADDQDSANKPAPWKSSLELGAVASSGNTDQRSVKFRADTIHNGPRIKHTFHVDAFRQTQNGVVSTNKFYSTYQADYKFDDRNAAFGRVAYEDDHFSGYDYQTDITFGYNRVMLLRDNMELDGDIGAGERQSKLDDGTTRNETIVRTALKYVWQIGETAQFNQLISVEFGSNQVSRSETSLQSTLVGNLAMKLSVNVKHQSRVPAGIKNTDTETSVTVVYHF